MTKQKKVAQDFYRHFPAVTAISWAIRQTEEEAYGHEHAKRNREEKARTCAAYFPKFSAIRIAASSNRSEEDLRRTLRHEFFGHYGLNSFLPEEKLNILESLLRIKDAGECSQQWGYLNRQYSGAPEHTLAEEFFAHTCESEEFLEVKLSADRLTKFLTDSEFLPTASDILGLRNLIRQKSAENTLEQKTFPSRNDSSFRAIDVSLAFKGTGLKTGRFPQIKELDRGSSIQP